MRFGRGRESSDLHVKVLAQVGVFGVAGLAELLLLEQITKTFFFVSAFFGKQLGVGLDKQLID